MEEVMWRQKSVAKDGDKNIKFFHQMADVRRRINFIGRIWRGNSFTENHLESKEEIATYFEQLYTSDCCPRPTLEGIHFPTITSLWDSLERHFEEEEIYLVLTEWEGDKVPSPNGFNFSFIQKACNFLKKDFCKLLLESHGMGRLSMEINATFFVLISKISNLVELRDCRLISLVGYVYKFLSKILPNRLRKVIPLIIGPSQGFLFKIRRFLMGCWLWMS